MSHFSKHDGSLTDRSLATSSASASGVNVPLHLVSREHMSAMVFTHTYNVPLLFEWWHPRTEIQYAASLLVIFCICLFQEWLHTRKRNVSDKEASSAAYEHMPLVNKAEAHQQLLGSQTTSRRIESAILHALFVAVHFLVMLLIMSFNSGVFFTVVLGLGTGHALFARSGFKPAQTRGRGSSMPTERSRS